MRILIILLFLPRFAVSETPRQAVEIIQKANKQINSPVTSECLSCEAGARATEEPVKSDQELCLQALCPQFEFSSITYASAMAIDSEMKEVDETVKRVFQTEMETQLKQSQKALEVLESRQKITDPQGVRFLNMTQITRYFESLTYVSAKGGYVIDVTATREKLKSLPQDQFDNLIRAGNHLLASNIEMSEYEAQILREEGPGQTREMIHLLDQIDKDYDEIVKNWGLPKGNLYSGYAEVSKRVRAGHADETDVDLITNYFAVSGLLKKMIEDPILMENLSAKIFDPAEIFPPSRRQELMTSIKDMKTFLASPAQAVSLQQTAKRTAMTCMTGLTSAKQILPTEEQLKDYPYRFKQSKKQFLAGLKSYFSKESQQKIARDAGDWTTRLPLSYKKFRKSILSELERENQTTLSTANLLSSLMTKNLQLGTAFLMSSFISSDALPDTTGLEDVCLKAFPNPIPDAATGRDLIKIGSWNVTKPSFGDEVNKHEMAHLVSSMAENGELSKTTLEWYNKSRACLAEPYSSQNFVEEDWADLLTTFTAGENFACTFFGLAQDFSLKPGSEDSHSSDFYRMLHIQLLRKGSIPASCTRALKQQGEEFKLKDCRNPSSLTATSDFFSKATF
jgi:hypothetical protein